MYNDEIIETWGLGIFDIMPSQDYGWDGIDARHRPVILTNVRECEGRVTALALVSAFRGTGQVEWEYFLASVLIYAAIDALASGSDTADITNMFNRDLLASRGRVFTQQQLFEHVIKWFVVEEDSEDCLRLRLRVNKSEEVV